MHRPLVALCVLLTCSVTSAAQNRAPVDEDLPRYVKVTGISGTLSSVGSDTLANLMTRWAEEFRRLYPNVNLQIQAAGSSTAPPALTEGTASLGPMSRLMKDNEISAFERRRGYKPTPIAVAIDALALFVHRDNPVEGLTLRQIDAIFSATLNCGAREPVERWGQLGVGEPWRDHVIQLHGRNSVSGTYGYFKQHALCRGDFRKDVNEQPGSASVVQALSTSPNGIGYSGVGYSTSWVRAVPVSARPGQPFVAPLPENAIDGSYPLARFLYIYVNREPGRPLPPLTREFLLMALSHSGQKTVVKDGYIPLPAPVATREAALLTTDPAAGDEAKTAN